MNPPHSILLADDHALFRDGIASLIRAGGLEVAGQAKDGAEAIELTRKLRPELVLMDVNMPGISGLDATRAIKTEMPQVKVVMLTVSDEEDDLFEAIKSGADGYILKDTPSEDFTELLERVFENEPAISKGLAIKLFDELRGGARSSSVKPGSREELTERETAVLELAARGATNREIATKLFISESTVNYHMRNVLSKLHFRNRTEAATYAIRRGLIDPPHSR